MAARGLRRLEADGEQRQHTLARSGLHILELGVEHPIESETGAPPPVVPAVFGRLLPIEAVERGGKALLPRHIDHVGDADHRVLKQRGQDREVFLVERDEFQRFHGLGARLLGLDVARLRGDMKPSTWERAEVETVTED